MHLYRQPIILFGAVLPILATAALIGIFSMIKSNMVASAEIKQKSYKASQAGKLAGLAIEAQVGRQKTTTMIFNSFFCMVYSKTITRIRIRINFII